MDKEKADMIIYTTEDGLTKVETTFDGDTVWLSIDQMAELFQRDRSVIGKHVRNIFKEGELEKESVWAKFAYTATDGKVYNVDYYNLDVIISVGYRVKSKRGTQFRIWATGILKEYMRKGFALDDDRLKNLGGGGYFKELLDRIRDIRASEKVFYRQVLEIYATSIDYDPKAEISIAFFKKVQNKIHYAIHGQTAAEVIYTRADAEKEFMGLTTFKGNQPTLREAVVAKNYLSEKELRAMGQLVSGYLDFAERQAEREQAMTMRDWAEYLDRILTMSGMKNLFWNTILDIILHCQLVHRKYRGRWMMALGKVQNKMHYAVHGHTAAELIYERADADKPHMGLSTWAAAPKFRFTICLFTDKVLFSKSISSHVKANASLIRKPV